jgi:GT2 family glycosyltransferase
LERAVASLTSGQDLDRGRDQEVVVVANGAPTPPHDGLPGARILSLASNLGVPGGRDAGLRSTESAVVGFLDDDAAFRGDIRAVAEAFDHDPTLGAVSFRLVDEDGRSSARHVPRPGGRDAHAGGMVAQFLGGASAIRRDAYDEVGGYFTDLHYGHEEIELCWRLVDAGWSIRYLAEIEVFHPRTDISRHDNGWRLTGRNRVWIARRTLPWPIAVVHVAVWLVLGLFRTPDARCRRQYVAGWWSGWRQRWPDGSPRRAISWRTVWALTRLGRPPVI